MAKELIRQTNKQYLIYLYNINGVEGARYKAKKDLGISLTELFIRLNKICNNVLITTITTVVFVCYISETIYNIYLHN